MVSLLPVHSPSLAPLRPWLRARLGRPVAGDLGAAFAGRLGDRTLHPTPTGRHALWAFLDTLDLAPGDEVLVPAWNYWVVPHILVQRGLVPVFVDVEADTLCLAPAHLPGRRTARTRLVVVTHLFGHPANMPAICAWAAAEGLPVFEDCAHAVGTTVDTPDGPRAAGTFGAGALFSFGIYKLVSALGGGMLALAPGHPPPPPGEAAGPTREQAARALVSALMQPGVYGATLGPLLARSGRLHDALHPSAPPERYRFAPTDRAPFQPFMADAIARQLGTLDETIAARRANVDRVVAAVAGNGGVTPLAPDRHGRANGAYFGLWVDDAEARARRLAARGVETQVRPFQDGSRVARFGGRGGPCPVAAAADARLLRLPDSPALRPRDLDRVIAGLLDA